MPQIKQHSRVLSGLAIIGAAAATFVLPMAARADSQTELNNSASPIQEQHGQYWRHSHQSFPLDATGQFAIDNIDGQIEIHGWSSNLVSVTAAVHGRTRESVETVKVTVDSDAHRVNVRTDQHSRHKNATVDYIVYVPENARLKEVSSVNGNVEVDGVAGDIAVSTVNGQTKVEGASARLKLETVNGNVMAQLSRLGDGQIVSAKTINGRIKLQVPDHSNARFKVNTLNGRIQSGFENLKVASGAVGHTVNASLGNGSGEVKAETVNGGIEIVKNTAI